MRVNINTAQVSANTIGAPFNQVGRNQRLVLQNLSTNNVFYGGNGVTTSNGAVLLPVATNPIPTYLDVYSNVYFVVASGTSLVSVGAIY